MHFWHLIKSIFNKFNLIVPKNLSTFTLTLIVLFNQAQTNLVPNPGFEDSLFCHWNFPGFPMDIDSTKYWKNATRGTCDYFNNCGTNTIVNTYLHGSEVPHGGNAFAGFYAYSGYKNGVYAGYQEYLMCKLNQTFSPDSKYEVRYYLSLSDHSNFSASKVGVYFAKTADTLGIGSFTNNLNFKPMAINRKNFPITKSGWHQVVDTITTYGGGESLMIIGNFEPANVVPFFVGTGNIADSSCYIFIDDISVKWVASTVGVEKQGTFSSLKVITTEDKLCVVANNLNQCELFLIDIFGNCIINTKPTSNQFVIETAGIPKGVYTLELICGQKRLRKKALIN